MSVNLDQVWHMAKFIQYWLKIRIVVFVARPIKRASAVESLF